MKEVELAPKLQPKISIEAEVISPDSFAGKKAVEIAELPVWRGSRKCKLGEFFNVKGDATTTANDVQVTIAGEVPRTKYIGAKMTTGEIVIKGSVDMHIGSQMEGGRITVEGDVDAFAGAAMRGGEILIRGNAGAYLGSAYRGDWRGMRGGRITVEGNAGSEVGTWMRGGLIIIKGNVGAFTGVHMQSGTIVIEGNPGPRLGAQMSGGIIIVLGKAEELLPSFSYKETVPEVKVEEKVFKGPFLAYVGDLAEGGGGQLFLHREKNAHLVSSR